MNFPLSIGASPGTLLCEDITINDDNLSEGTETFTFDITSFSPLVMVNPARNRATVEIMDDDGRSACEVTT